ncbi:MAG: PLP-dependent aminotransferase family protein [Actinobacteria bacterium]|nr:PLP-dependent aminotransferase family protein [Actinomycetota bacterium]
MAQLLPLPRLRAVLGDWTHGEGPLYRRLGAALVAGIETGRIPGGVRLPPERELAAELSVSRSTVAAALEEVDAARLIDRRQGSGTYVARRRPAPDEGRRELVEELDEHALLRDLSGRPQARIEFVAAAVPCAPEVLTATRELDDATLERWTSGHGYVPLGVPPLREAIAEHLTDRGLGTAPEQVMVTTGAVEAVLLAARLFVEPGDPVAVESPTYVGALDVLRSVGGRLLGVDVDHHGARTDQLADILARSLPRLVYLVPDFHNPTGVVLDAARRREVSRLAAEFHVPVIEDLVQQELWFETPPPAPIAAADPTAPVLTVGSMSKVFWGGLRIGWVRADPVTIERLGRIKTVTNYGTPIIDQLVAARLLPQTDVVAGRRREQLTAQLDHLEAALRRELPDWSWTRPAGGLALWVQLPSHDAAMFAATVDRHGVAVAPGPTFGIAAREHHDRVRLTFVAPPEVIDDGVRRLAAAWDDLARRGDVRRREALVV